MRTWLYQKLVNDPTLEGIFGARMYQGESMTTSVIEKPFLVYTIGNATNELLSEDDDQPQRQFFQIYIHDEPADYTRIDDAIDAVKKLLVNSTDNGDVINVLYLETSRDLDDETMGTIMRYIRFQAIKRR